MTLLKSKVANYRALVTDINRKGMMNGWEAAKAAREIDPAFPIVYMTGAAAGDWASRGVSNSILLEKPFAPAQRCESKGETSALETLYLFHQARGRSCNAFSMMNSASNTASALVSATPVRIRIGSRKTIHFQQHGLVVSNISNRMPLCSLAVPQTPARNSYPLT